MPRMWPALLISMIALAGQASQAADDLGRWHAGPYSYSDEMGGFAIVAISGTGSAQDPVVLTQEFFSASPVTVVIRAERPIRPQHMEGDFANGIIYIRTEAINNSGLPWLEFEFELQEVRGEPSIFGDGLSFDQRRTDSVNISSDRFEEFSRDYEPFDRLLYRNGTVDPGETARFDFLITDFTPRWQFFLVQDPTVPFS
ncbi:hypothetical protein [Mesorhizobium sp. CAU 1741]|uniref:hypothetical protein n=1 Tax=Mesorhizobium sp. CAU 1741 TaxID=3140366 RepID=UPI00325AB96F